MANELTPAVLAVRAALERNDHDAVRRIHVRAWETQRAADALVEAARETQLASWNERIRIEQEIERVRGTVEDIPPQLPPAPAPEVRAVSGAALPSQLNVAGVDGGRGDL